MIELLQKWAKLAPEEITVGRRGTTMCLVSSPLISPYVLELAIDENSPHNAHPYFDLIVQGMVQRALVNRDDLSFNLQFYHHMMNRQESWAVPFEFRITSDIDSRLNIESPQEKAGLAALKAYIKFLEGLASD